MQNIPVADALNSTKIDASRLIKSFSKGDVDGLFAKLFDGHSARVTEELALAPVSHDTKVVDAAPEVVKIDEPKAAPKTITGNEAAKNTPPEDIKMTREDLDEVREDLKAYGVTDEEIAAIEEKIDSEDGYTWGQFVNFLNDKMTAGKVELTPELSKQLDSFFTKLGFNKEETANLKVMLQQGKRSEVMAAIQEKMDTLPKDKQLLVSKKEIEAFISVANVSKSMGENLRKIFTKGAKPAEIKSAMADIQKEMIALDAKDEKLVKAVGVGVAKAIANQTKSETVAEDVKAPVDLKPKAAAEEIKNDAPREVARNDNDGKPAATNTLTKEAVKAVNTGTKDASTDQGPRQDTRNDDNKNAWNQFFSRLSEDKSGNPNQFSARTVAADTTVKTGLSMANAATSKSTSTPAWEKVAAPRVMKQVETAIFKNLGNGRKSLIVNLNPANLGKMSVKVSVLNNEVSARIRVDNADTARMIAENIDIIKTSLESQGLKVDKLDIQTNLSGNQDSANWQGENRHNLAREQEALAAMRNRIKNLKTDADGLARDLQNTSHQAINAEQGLHVIA